MKKINNLEIKPEKLIDSNKLTTLKGGSMGYQCWDCKVMDGGELVTWDTWCAQDLMTAQGDCATHWGLACYCF
jgi:hypothetical protein